MPIPHRSYATPLVLPVILQVAGALATLVHRVTRPVASLLRSQRKRCSKRYRLLSRNSNYLGYRSTSPLIYLSAACHQRCVGYFSMCSTVKALSAPPDSQDLKRILNCGTAAHRTNKEKYINSILYIKTVKEKLGIYKDKPHNPLNPKDITTNGPTHYR